MPRADVRVLVLGGSGMLGHKLAQAFAGRFETWATFRREVPPAWQPLYRGVQVVDGVSAEDFDSVESVVRAVHPHVVVNCIGIVKQAALAEDPIVSIEINALFPHRLASLCEAAGARLVQISTDCVFSGRSGLYSESDIPDPVDLYGRSKLLGEVADQALTIRTSIIGRELDTSHGLLEWFLAQDRQSVRGFRRAIFSGFPTGALARHLAQLIEMGAPLHGIWHLASEPISKYDLLVLFREAYEIDVEITPEDEFACDRSLDGGRLASAAGHRVNSWYDLVEEMAADPTPYSQLREATPC